MHVVIGKNECGDTNVLDTFVRMLPDGIPHDHDATGWVLLATNLARELSFSSRPETARRLFHRVADEIGDIDRAEPSVAARLHAARAVFILVSDGNPAAALHEVRRARLRFEEAGDLRRACLEQSNIGFGELELGLYQDAEATLCYALATAEHMGLDSVVDTAKHNLSLALAHKGRRDEARELARTAAESFERHGNHRLAATCRIYLAEILLLDSSIAQAESEARHALALSPDNTYANVLSWAMLARVMLARADKEKSLLMSSQAMASMQELGGIEEGEAMVRLVYAEALHANGEHDKARDAIFAARERLLERAAKIDVPEWRDSFLHNVPDHARTLELAEKWAGKPAGPPD